MLTHLGLLSLQVMTSNLPQRTSNSWAAQFYLNSRVVMQQRQWGTCCTPKKKDASSDRVLCPSLFLISSIGNWWCERCGGQDKLMIVWRVQWMSEYFPKEWLVLHFYPCKTSKELNSNRLWFNWAQSTLSSLSITVAGSVTNYMPRIECSQDLISQHTLIWCKR